MKPKSYYLDCLEIIEKNSRQSDYCQNKIKALKDLIDSHYELVEASKVQSLRVYDLVRENQNLRRENQNLKLKFGR